MDSEIKDAFRTNDYVATGERTAVIEAVEVTGEPVNASERQAARDRDADAARQQAARNPEPSMNNDTGAAALFGADEAQNLRSRWHQIQVEFVDEPRKSVQQADQLVQNVTERLSQIFADQRNRLEGEWDKGESSTEELRNAFRRYRTLFDRLLSI